MYLTPHDGNFQNFPYYASMSSRMLEKTLESTCNIFRLSTCQSMVNCLSLTILFMTHQSYLFLWQPVFSRLLQSFFQKIIDISRVTCTDFLDYEYMNTPPRLHIQMNYLQQYGYIFSSRATTAPSISICMSTLS